MVSLSKVRSYKPEEIDIGKLVENANQIFHKQPFEWQLDVPRAVLCGEDVVLDVGTGSGKTLCFSLPLLLDETGTEIILTISPLTALQVGRHSRYSYSCCLCRNYSTCWHEANV